MSPSSPVIDRTPSIPSASATFPDDHKSDIEKATPGGSVVHGEAVDGVINPEKGGHADLSRKLSRYHISMIGWSGGIGTGASSQLFRPFLARLTVPSLAQGLFIGAGAAYAKSGPAGLLLYA